MSRKTLAFIFIAFLLNLVSHSQNEVFLDLDFKPITKTEFDKKCKTTVLKCLKYSKDSLLLNQLLYKYNFDTLKNNDWSTFKEDLEASLTDFKLYGKGFFNSAKNNHKTHCF